MPTTLSICSLVKASEKDGMIREKPRPAPPSWMVAFQSNSFSPVVPSAIREIGERIRRLEPERTLWLPFSVRTVAADAGRLENLFSGIELEGRAGLGLREGDGMHPHHRQDERDRQIAPDGIVRDLA